MSTTLSGPRIRQSEVLCARMRTIIDREEEGNVAAAARRMGVSQRGLQKVYAGVTRDPRASMVIRMAKAYNLDPSWLLTGIRKNTPASVQREAVRLALSMVRNMADQVAVDTAMLMPIPQTSSERALADLG